MAAGIGLQLAFAILVILVPGGREFFNFLSALFVKVVGFAMEGSAFIFGDLAPHRTNSASCLPSRCCPPSSFFASLMAVLYHLNVMQKVVQAMAWVMQKILQCLRFGKPVGGGQRIRRPDRGAAGGAPLHLRA